MSVQDDVTVMVGPAGASLRREGPAVAVTESDSCELVRGSVAAVRRVACFFALVMALAFALDAMITSGLRHMTTSQYGVSNRIMRGLVNADIVITGSSRALSHYDPRIIQAITGYSAFNLGRNGSQTDMQVAVFKAYLVRNRKPRILIHNLDAFTFVTTREVYDPVQYVPYLYDANCTGRCGGLIGTYGRAATCRCTDMWSMT